MYSSHFTLFQMRYFVLILTAVFFTSCHTEKIGWVDTEVLLKSYPPLIEARTAYEKENTIILEELELKKQAFDIKEKHFLANEKTYGKTKRAQEVEKLKMLAAKSQNELNNRMRGLQATSQRIIDSLITDVKLKVEAYGKAHNYTYIYGKNDAGSILYGADSKNLTQKILSQLKTD